MAIAAAIPAKPVALRCGLLRATQLLREAGIENASLDAEVLLRHVLAIETEHLYLNGDRLLGEPELALFWGLIERRARREPVAYITGNKEFWSLDFLVTPDVLIPRPETERLIEVSLELARKTEQGAWSGEHGAGNQEPEISAQCSMLFAPCALRVLELGTGCGAVAVSLAKELPEAEIVAIDVSAGALEVARKNAARHGSRQIRFCPGDLFEAIAEARDGFHLIVSNPPYVRSGELRMLPRDIRDWEPVIALDGGTDGLDYYRRIALDAHRYLVDGGYVVLEIGADQGAEVCDLFSLMDRYAAPALYQDFSGRDRVVAARKSQRSGHG
jgi:release factor glutamine methyltransferase